MAKLITKTPDIRLRWTKGLFEENDDGKYSVALLIDKGNEKRIAQIKKMIQEAGEEFFGDKFDKLKNSPTFKLPLRDGDDLNVNRDEPYNPGYMFMNASSGSQPQIVSRYKDAHAANPADRNKPRIITELAEVYDGVFAKVSLTFKGYKNESSGVACYINSAQIWHEGERMAGAQEDAQDTFDGEDMDAEDEFGDEPDTSGDDFDF